LSWIDFYLRRLSASFAALLAEYHIPDTALESRQRRTEDKVRKVAYQDNFLRQTYSWLWTNSLVFRELTGIADILHKYKAPRSVRRFVRAHNFMLRTPLQQMGDVIFIGIPLYIFRPIALACTISFAILVFICKLPLFALDHTKVVLLARFSARRPYAYTRPMEPFVWLAKTMGAIATGTMNVFVAILDCMAWIIVGLGYINTLVQTKILDLLVFDLLPRLPTPLFVLSVRLIKPFLRVLAFVAYICMYYFALGLILHNVHILVHYYIHFLVTIYILTRGQTQQVKDAVTEVVFNLIIPLFIYNYALLPNHITFQYFADAKTSMDGLPHPGKAVPNDVTLWGYPVSSTPFAFPAMTRRYFRKRKGYFRDGHRFKIKRHLHKKVPEKRNRWPRWIKKRTRRKRFFFGKQAYRHKEFRYTTGERKRKDRFTKWRRKLKRKKKYRKARKRLRKKMKRRLKKWRFSNMALYRRRTRRMRGMQREFRNYAYIYAFPHRYQSRMHRKKRKLFASNIDGLKLTKITTVRSRRYNMAAAKLPKRLVRRKVLADWKQRLELENVFDRLVLLVSSDAEDFLGEIEKGEAMARLDAYAAGRAEINHELRRKKKRPLSPTAKTVTRTNQTFAGRVMLSVAVMQTSGIEYERLAFMTLGYRIRPRPRPKVSDGKPRTLTMIDFDDSGIDDDMDDFLASNGDIH